MLNGNDDPDHGTPVVTYLGQEIVKVRQQSLLNGNDDPDHGTPVVTYLGQEIVKVKH